MHHPLLPVVAGLALVLGVGGFVYFQHADSGTGAATQRQNPSPEQNAAEQVPVSSEEMQTERTISMSEVEAHADASSCWAVINGGVYDLTGWIPQHPGGPERIAQLCGTDGSEKFNRQHGGSSRIETILMGFKIGELAR